MLLWFYAVAFVYFSFFMIYDAMRGYAILCFINACGAAWSHTHFIRLISGDNK